MGSSRSDAEYRDALRFKVALLVDPVLALRQTAAERLLSEIELGSPMREAWRQRQAWESGWASERERKRR